MKRPTSVTVLGTIGVLWGGFTLLIGVPFWIAFAIDPLGLMERIAAWGNTTFPPGFREALQIPVMRFAALASGLVDLAISGVLLIGAWKLLALQEQGRRLMLGFALAFLFWKGMNFLLDRAVYEPVRQQYNIVQKERGRLAIPIDFVYAVAVLYFLTRPAIRDAMHDSRPANSVLSH